MNALKASVGLLLALASLVGDARPCVAQAPPTAVSTSEYPSFNEALAALTAAGGGALVVDSASVLTAGAEVPETVALEFEPTGSVDLGANALVLHCRVVADARQIFLNVTGLSGTIAPDPVLPQWFGAKADGVSDDTLALQTTLNLIAGGRALVARGVAPYKTGPLVVNSDSVIEMEQGTIIEANPGLPEEARLINISDVSNVYVSGNGAVVRLLRAEYLAGEQRHGVDIVGSNNVTIDDLTVLDSGGDGFYVGPSRTPGGQAYSEGVSLFNCVADNNLRQGLSIVSGENIVVEGCVFMHSNGTDPQSGVDLEPDSNLERLVNISLINCRFVGNAVSGLVIALTALDQETLPHGIRVVGCHAQGNAIGVYLRCVRSGVEGEIQLLGLTFKDNLEDYRVEDCPRDRPEKLNVTTSQGPDAP